MIFNTKYFDFRLKIAIKRDQQELILLVDETELTSTTLNRNARLEI